MRGVSIIRGRVRVCLFLCVFLGLAGVGCGPSPAMQRAQPPKAPPNAVVVVVDCDDAEADDDDAEAASTASATGARTPVEYVRIDEWQQPSAAREVEARIEPRGNKSPDYVSLPKLTMHREIAPTTTFRTGRYWW